MLILNLSFVPTFIFWAGIVMFLNIQSIIRTKSIFSCINLVISLLLIVLHIGVRNTLPNWSFSIICDFAFLAISISIYLYIDDIEARRKVISEVFENRYKKSNK